MCLKCLLYLKNRMCLIHYFLKNHLSPKFRMYLQFEIHQLNL